MGYKNKIINLKDKKWEIVYLSKKIILSNKLKKENLINNRFKR